MQEITLSTGEFFGIVAGAIAVTFIAGWLFHLTIEGELRGIREHLKRIADVEEKKWKEWKL